MQQLQTILVVDDDTNARQHVVTHLEQQGFRVLVAADGLQGLNVARKESPNLIIVDTQMPNMNGFKMARMLKFDGQYEGIPVLMTMTEAEKSQIGLALKTGATEVIMKPIDFDDLDRRIAACIKATSE